MAGEVCLRFRYLGSYVTLSIMDREGQQHDCLGECGFHRNYEKKKKGPERKKKQPDDACKYYFHKSESFDINYANIGPIVVVTSALLISTAPQICKPISRSVHRFQIVWSTLAYET